MCSAPSIPNTKGSAKNKTEDISPPPAKSISLSNAWDTVVSMLTTQLDAEKSEESDSEGE